MNYQSFVRVERVTRMLEKVVSIEDRATRLEDFATTLRSEAAAIRGQLDGMMSKPDLTISVSVPDTAQMSLPGTDSEPVREDNQNRYMIQRGHYSYADVVWKEVLKSEFELTEAWEAIKDKIANQSDRGRDSCRHSLNHDPRFERLADRKGTWFRRRSPGQIDSAPSTAGTVEGATTTS